jgi:hypothetical protein
MRGTLLEPDRPGAREVGVRLKKGFREMVDEAKSRIRTLSLEDAHARHGRDDVVFVDLRESTRDPNNHVAALSFVAKVGLAGLSGRLSMLVLMGLVLVVAAHREIGRLSSCSSLSSWTSTPSPTCGVAGAIPGARCP